MGTLKCIIIDDEPLAIEILESYITRIDHLEIAGTFRNAVSAFTFLQTNSVDLIFLDIQMPKLTGIDFLKTLKHPPKVIFVTAYREYAVDGFELDAVDYLVKPVSFERFFKAITKLNRLMGQETSAGATGETTTASAFVYLKVDKDMKKIFVNEIEYIESWKDYVMVFLTGGKHFLVKQSISAMENLLSEHKFMRVHRSYMVSLSKIGGYNGVSVQLNDKEIPIGRLYKQTVMDRLQVK